MHGPTGWLEDIAPLSYDIFLQDALISMGPASSWMVKRAGGMHKLGTCVVHLALEEDPTCTTDVLPEWFSQSAYEY